MKKENSKVGKVKGRQGKMESLKNMKEIALASFVSAELRKMADKKPSCLKDENFMCRNATKITDAAKFLRHS
jgi:hypothetical protein